MNCEEAKKDLVELVFGEPDAGREILLHQHLAGCESCRGEERRLLRLREDLRGEIPVAGPEIRRRIRDALPRRRRRDALAFLRRPVPAYVAAAACLAGVLFARGVPERAVVKGGAPSATTVIEESPTPFAVAGSYETAVTWEALSTDSL
ncbi:MAG: zf-HC2 domain-containing protein [Candidatus Eisenbacteria bacterium]